MGIKIFEGVVERLSKGTVSEGVITTYEFIEIGGQRVRHVQADNFLGTFIKPGDRIAIACDKGLGAPHRVRAVREPNGNISKTDKSPLFVISGVCFGLGLVLSLIPMIFMLALISMEVAIVLWLVIGLVTAWACTRNMFKARNALDHLSSIPKSTPSQGW